MDSLQVVAIASSEETRASLLAQLQGLSFVKFEGVYIELSDAVRQCQEVGPDVIIVDMTGRELDAGLFIQAIGMNPLNPCVIFALHRDMDLNLFRETIRQGAKEFIQYPEDRQTLETSLRQHLALLSKMSLNQKATALASTPDEENEAPGRLISVFAAKGGVGCSTVAVNLAYEILHTKKADGKPPRVVFFDMDQVFCNSAIMLNHKPNYSLSDLAVTDTRDIDDALFRKIIHKVEAGIHVVVGSKSVLDDNEMVSPELLELTLNHLTAHYDYVIADLPTHVLDPYHQYMVERSDEILLVSCPDIPSLYRTRQYLDLAQKYLDMTKVKMVLNRYNMKAAYKMSNQTVEEQFRYDIFSRLPNDWDLNVEANSLGTFISKANPKSELGKALQKLAGQLTGDAPVENAKPKNDADKKGGLMSKLFTKAKEASSNVAS